MDIFYLKVDNFIKYKRTDKFLRDFILKNFYHIEDEVILVNKKPKLKNGEIHFSISHSKNIVAIAFDKVETGFDIEFNRERDYNKIAKRYNKEFNTKEDFYFFWTNLEAEIKLQAKKRDIFQTRIEDYIATVVSTDKIKNIDLQ